MGWVEGKGNPAVARERGGGALCSVHVPRRQPVAAFSSFTSLRRAPRRPAPFARAQMSEPYG
jgi:hypothetical protein